MSADTVAIQEWAVPYERSRPRDPYVENAESVWFVGQRNDYLARFDVATGAFEKVDLESGAGPHNAGGQAIVGTVTHGGRGPAEISKSAALHGHLEADREVLPGARRKRLDRLPLSWRAWRRAQAQGARALQARALYNGGY